MLTGCSGVGEPVAATFFFGIGIGLIGAAMTYASQPQPPIRHGFTSQPQRPIPHGFEVLTAEPVDEPDKKHSS